MDTRPPGGNSLPDQPVPFLWRYVRRRPWHFGTLFGLIVGAASCAVAVQYGMKLLVDAMAMGQEAGRVWPPFFPVLTRDRQAMADLVRSDPYLPSRVVENLFWRSAGYLGCRTVVSSGADLRIDLFNYLTGHPMRYFSQHFAGSLANRISSAGGAAGGIYGGLAWKIIPPFTVQLTMGFALIVSVLIVATLITRMGIRGRRRHIEYAAQSAKVSGEIVDMVSNVWSIKAFSARERERRRLEAAIGSEAKAHRHSWIYLENARVFHDFCLSIMAGGMLGWAILQWQQGQITPGDVVMVSALTFRILHGSRDLALALVDTSQQLGVIADTLRIIVQPHALSDAVEHLDESHGSIRFVDVSYTYADGRSAIKHLFVDIPAGQRVGIVGPSGAGKSTLIKLVQRLDDVRTGVILIDDRDIRSVSQDSLRKQIAVVPQEPALFNRTIYENIAYGQPNATEEQIIDAARHAYCDEFIRALPKGYDTVVGERGGKLSGGQRQRLGIARAFLKNAPILILDEATSALDSESEAQIQLALDDLMQGRTVLAVAHRLSTVARFDRILVLQAGELVEDGPPDELRRAGGVFQLLWQAQGMFEDY